jgi:hypothetical protein
MQLRGVFIAGEFMQSQGEILMGLTLWGLMLVLPTYWYSLGRLAEKTCLRSFAIGWTSPSGIQFGPTNPTDFYLNDAGAEIDSCVNWYEVFAEVYILMLIVVSATAVYKNRYAPHLLFTESPVRREGFLSKIGMGYRFNSLRNFMSFFTMCLEFYQTWGLTWGASQMDVLYIVRNGTNETVAPVIASAYDASILESVLPFNSSNATNATNITAVYVSPFNSWDSEKFLFAATNIPDDRECGTPMHGKAHTALGGLTMCARALHSIAGSFYEHTSLLTFWVVVGMCGLWTFLYCLPHVITTTTVGNRALALHLMELYRKILW